ncbi:hypothetical protein [Nocardioides sp. YIM 152588]|uniref:hypothetical protein n=1 Tax=Nocardioides sp. YIM 152588 TaxID=3158259 RepID=UPI0032E42802
MNWRDVLFLACTFFLSALLLAVFHYEGDPTWLTENLPAVEGGDGILWQVHATFLSVGFAGLAIAAQLFAEAPLAIGASRSRVLDHIWAGWFAGVGLVGNAVIAFETIWLPSGMGVLVSAAVWFVPTVALLVLSTLRLVQLFGHPSRLDEVVKTSLVESISSRLESVSQTYGEARRQLKDLVTSTWEIGILNPAGETLRVPVPEVGRVVKSIKPKVLRRALDSLGPRATETAIDGDGSAETYTPPRLTLDVEPGDRTRLGETAFRVSTEQELDEETQRKLVRLLQSSVEFEVSGTVTPDEETDREIGILKDAIGTNIRSGALSTAERALELLGHVVKGVWLARPETLDSSRRTSFTRRDWLFRSISEVEQDVLLSPRVAGIFVSAAMSRALEAPRMDSSEYVDECLRSFTRIWLDVLQHGGPEFKNLPERIVVCVQNLAAYSRSDADRRQDLPARATWAMVELVKLALDAKKPDAAKLAANELNELFRFSDDGGAGRAHVRAGQLVLSGWLDYLGDKNDDRDPADPELRPLVAPQGTWAEIIEARALAERGVAPFSRWDWWELRGTGSGRAQALQLSDYIDKAQLHALASSFGSLPPANDQEIASEYKRFVRVLDAGQAELSDKQKNLKRKFEEEIGKWDAAEDGRLALAPLSDAKVGDLKAALVSALKKSDRLADEIPVVDEVPPSADSAKPILGMNFRVPRNYLVDEVFNQTYADPRDLGQVIARGFTDAEDHKLVDLLRSIQGEVREATVQAILGQIMALGDDASEYVFASPYGGLMDVHEWHSADFRAALGRVTHVETAMLDDEAILFDRRSTVLSARSPEQKDGLSPVTGTSIALGIFEDVYGGNEPQVRVETGEYFVAWRGEDPRVFRFGPVWETETAESADAESVTSEEDAVPET